MSLPVVAVHARDNKPAPAAFAAGCRAMGAKVAFLRPVADNTDIHPTAKHALILSYRGANRIIADLYRAAGVPVWIMELPRLRMSSGVDENAKTLAYGFYLDSLHYLPPMPGNYARVFGVIPNRRSQYILVGGQKPADASHGMDADAIEGWARNTIARARAIYKMPVVFRHHPRSVDFFDPLEAFGADRVSVPTDETLRDAMAGAAVVTYNSTSGVDAIDAGVPVLYEAGAAMCAYAPYATPFGEPITALSAAKREECLLRFAACQFTMEQLQDGTAYRHTMGGEPWPFAELVELNADEATARKARTLEVANSLADVSPVEVVQKRRGRPRKVVADA